MHALAWSCNALPMKWFLALLMVFALGEAGLSACSSNHAHAQVEVSDADVDMSMAHNGHDMANHHHHDHAMAMVEEGPAKPTPSSHHDTCPDCLAGRGCEQCVVVSATRLSGHESGPLQTVAVRTAHYSDVAPGRPINFDPPPPKA